MVGLADEVNARELAFWMSGPDAVDDRAAQAVRNVAAGYPPEDRSEVQVPREQVGSLLPLNGPVGEELWGGFKQASTSIWGSVSSNLDWDRFLDRVKETPWSDPGRVQLLMMEDGDSYFRMYMFSGDDLVNVVPAPPDEGHARPW